jgi:hypothetical protein
MIVLRVKINGKTKYVRGIPSQFNSDALVDDPLKAKQFKSADPMTNGDLREVLGWINVQGDKMYSKSGLWVDDVPEIVTFKIKIEEDKVISSRA